MTRPVVHGRGQGDPAPGRGQPDYVPEWDQEEAHLNEWPEDAADWAEPGYAPGPDRGRPSARGRTGAAVRERRQAPARDQEQLAADRAAKLERAEHRAGPYRNRIDNWMEHTYKFGGSQIKRKTIALILMGIPGPLPMFFMSRAIIEQNQNTLQALEADVFGTGSLLLLILTLTVTPLTIVSRQRWFVPLRKWYGIVLAFNATTDGVTASIVNQFRGGVVGRLTGHTFLLVGLVMVSILFPLMLISNNRCQKWLGKYWRSLQKLTYVVWGLLFLHLILLEGFGPQNGTNGPSSGFDPFPFNVFHQRVYELAACSLPLFLLRLGPVRRWVKGKQDAGQRWVVHATFAPLWALYILFFAFILNEEIFKGVSAFRLQPIGG